MILINFLYFLCLCVVGGSYEFMRCYNLFCRFIRKKVFGNCSLKDSFWLNCVLNFTANQPNEKCYDTKTIQRKRALQPQAVAIDLS